MTQNSKTPIQEALMARQDISEQQTHYISNLSRGGTSWPQRWTRSYEIWLIIGLHISLWRSYTGLLQNTYSLTFHLQTSNLTSVVLIGIQSARYSWQSEVKWNILHSNENAEWFLSIIQKHFLPPKGMNSANSNCSCVSTQNNYLVTSFWSPKESYC